MPAEDWPIFRSIEPSTFSPKSLANDGTARERRTSSSPCFPSGSSQSMSPEKAVSLPTWMAARVVVKWPPGSAAVGSVISNFCP